MNAAPPSSILVVGAGAAGAQGVLTLRQLGYDGVINFVGAEVYAPYERPPLSKEVLTSVNETQPTCLVDFDMLRDLHVGMWSGRAVESIDWQGQSASLDNGVRLSFDRLLLATGCSPRILDITGATLNGVHYLRSFDDAWRIREALSLGGSVVVIGGGFIGLEVAAAARMLNCSVTVIEAGSQLMGRGVPTSIAEILTREHRRRGVRVELGCRPAQLLGKHSVERVRLQDGRELDASVVIIGIGVIPEVSLGTQIGAVADDGIVVDADCRTSVVGAFAAGDCCRMHSSEVRGVRLEAWQSALEQGGRAAHAMLGLSQSAPGCAWMWSNQYDHQLQAVGTPAQVDRIVARGDHEKGELICFQLFKGRLVGAVSVNRNRDLAVMRRVLLSNPTVDPANLADEQWPLRQLIPRGAAASMS